MPPSYYNPKVTKPRAAAVQAGARTLQSGLGFRFTAKGFRALGV